MDQHLNVLVQSSDFYAPFAGVMLTSLFENNQDIERITVYLMISSDMSEKNKGRFQTLAEKYGREIKFIDTKKIDLFLNDNHVPQYHGGYIAYYKIFALSIIEDEIDRLIFLDADMLVVGSMSELLTCDLGNNVLGLCLDAHSSKYKDRIKVDSLFYHNTGMVVFDVKKWIGCKCTDKVIEHLTTVHAAYPVADQDLINIIFSKSITTLSLKYNCLTPVYVFKNYSLLKKAFGITNYYTEEEVMSAKREPVILHCLGFCGIHPWDDGWHPHKEIWREYKEKSPWADLPSLKYKVSFMNKVQRILFVLLPQNIFAIAQRNSINIVYFRRARKCGL